MSAPAASQTRAERLAHLKQANEVRIAAKEGLAKLGAMSPRPACAAASDLLVDSPRWLLATTVRRLLEAIPAIGRASAARIINVAAADGALRIAKLDDSARYRLAGALSQRALTGPAVGTGGGRPATTTAQRNAALAKANRTRRVRKELCDAIRALPSEQGRQLAAATIADRARAVELDGMTVGSLLAKVAWEGPMKAGVLARRGGVSPQTPLGKLTARQVARLAAVLRADCRGARFEFGAPALVGRYMHGREQRVLLLGKRDGRPALVDRGRYGEDVLAVLSPGNAEQQAIALARRYITQANDAARSARSAFAPRVAA